MTQFMSRSDPDAELPVAGHATPWLFSRTVDLWTFGGSAGCSLILLAVGGWAGLLHAEAPEWTWMTTVLLVDVAHVYATGFRVYLDRAELRRRPWLYLGAPVSVFLVGWAVASESVDAFWRLLAYLAVFHFVRQQYGWVQLYRVKAGERDRGGYWLDSAAIYLATLYPLLYWHCHLPRHFWWFVHGDFLSLPPRLATAVEPVYWIVLVGYFVRSLIRGCRWGLWNPGKDLVLFTTALCWYLGIVVFNSDYAFTVTNVIIHGVPYIVLVSWYWLSRQPRRSSGGGASLTMLLATIWMLAYFEELLWNRGVWQEHTWLFGQFAQSRTIQPFLIALLAVPQATHYVLDGFIWKRRSNRSFADSVALSDPR